MWKLGDAVVYGSAGICRIDDISDREFGGEIKKYYILKPLYDDKNTFFVPSFNETLMGKMYTVLTRSEALSLISAIPGIASDWIDNDKVRTETFKQILESGRRERVIYMLKALYDRRQMLTEKGKKLRSSDEILMRTGEQLIENEYAYIFNIDRHSVRDFIVSRLENA